MLTFQSSVEFREGRSATVLINVLKPRCNTCLEGAGVFYAFIGCSYKKNCISTIRSKGTRAVKKLY